MIRRLSLARPRPGAAARRAAPLPPEIRRTIRAGRICSGRLAPDRQPRRSAFTEERYFPFRREPVVLTGTVRLVPGRGLSLEYRAPGARARHRRPARRPRPRGRRPARSARRPPRPGRHNRPRRGPALRSAGTRPRLRPERGPRSARLDPDPDPARSRPRRQPALDRRQRKPGPSCAQIELNGRQPARRDPPGRPLHEGVAFTAADLAALFSPDRWNRRRQKDLARTALAALRGALPRLARCGSTMPRKNLHRRPRPDPRRRSSVARNSPWCATWPATSSRASCSSPCSECRHAPGRAPPAEAAHVQFAAALSRSPALRRGGAAHDDDGPADRDRLGRRPSSKRRLFTLLACPPGWAGRQRRVRRDRPAAAGNSSPWLAERAAARPRGLSCGARRPLAMQDLIPEDPPAAGSAAPRPGTPVRSDAPAAPARRDCALVWARIAGPRRSRMQGSGRSSRRSWLALARIRARTGPASRAALVGGRTASPRRAGPGSKAKIKRAQSRLLARDRRARGGRLPLRPRGCGRLLHLVPVIAAPSSAPGRSSTLVFPNGCTSWSSSIGSPLERRRHRLRFLHLHAAAPSARRALRGEARGGSSSRSLASCLTTVIGFSLLLWSDLPLIRQVGLFVSAGLLCALGAAMLYFGQLDQPFLEARSSFGRGPASGGGTPRRSRKWLRAVAGLAVAVALVGPWRLHWRDDVAGAGDFRAGTGGQRRRGTAPARIRRSGPGPRPSISLTAPPSPRRGPASGGISRLCWTTEVPRQRPRSRGLGAMAFPHGGGLAGAARPAGGGLGRLSAGDFGAALEPARVQRRIPSRPFFSRPGPPSPRPSPGRGSYDGALRWTTGRHPRRAAGPLLYQRPGGPMSWFLTILDAPIRARRRSHPPR